MSSPDAYKEEAAEKVRREALRTLKKARGSEE
jgi:hypothetical protein